MDKNKFMKSGGGDDDDSDDSYWGSDSEESSDEDMGTNRNQLDFFRIKPGMNKRSICFPFSLKY